MDSKRKGFGGKRIYGFNMTDFAVFLSHGFRIRFSNVTVEEKKGKKDLRKVN